MKRRAIGFVIALTLGWLLAGNAAAQGAETPAWQAAEVYSNQDGSVQYLVAVVVRDDVPLTGRWLYATDLDRNYHLYQFDREVPDNRPGRFILIGTQGFAALGLVEPDFVVPDGFLYLPEGSVVILASKTSGPIPFGSYDRWSSGARQGLLMRARACPNYDWDTGVVVGTTTCILPANVGRPVNNAGQHALLPLAGAEGHTGLYWGAPAGSESGWAIAVEHQAAVAAAVWFTYDTDGTPVWFMLPRAEVVLDAFGIPEDRAFAGPLYRFAGPAFGTAFDPSAVRASEVGYGGIRFPFRYEDWDDWSTRWVDVEGSFWYRLGNGATVTKPITQQVFAASVPVCVLGGQPAAPANYQGLWWNPAESGWGLHLTHQGEIVFAVWLTYDAAGRASWLTMTAQRTEGDTYAGTIYRTTGPRYDAPVFDASAVKIAPVGNASLTFSARGQGVFASTVDGVSQSKAITRQVFDRMPTVCNFGSPGE